MIQPNKKRILITGCDTRFGRHLMMKLIEDGHFIVSIGMHTGDNYQYDFTKLGWSEYDDIIDEIDRHYAGEWFDVLLNCTSYEPTGSIMDASETSMMDDLSLNLLAPLAITKFFIDRCEGIRSIKDINGNLTRVPKGGWRIIHLINDRFPNAALHRAMEILSDDFTHKSRSSKEPNPYVFANVMHYGGIFELEDAIKVFKFVIEDMPATMTSSTFRINTQL